MDSLSTYRKSDAAWGRSGEALSNPFYHYVLPTTILEPKKPLQTCGITIPTKRWESVAWFVAMSFDCQCVLISLYRKLITQEFGDFEKSFNIGNIDGGFGQSRGTAPTSTNLTPAVTAPITPSTRLRKEKIKSFRPASLFDSSGKTHSVADEFLQFSTTRKKLIAQIDLDMTSKRMKRKRLHFVGCLNRWTNAGRKSPTRCLQMLQHNDLFTLSQNTYI